MTIRLPLQRVAAAVAVAVGDVISGFSAVVHNALAVMGMVVVTLITVVLSDQAFLTKLENRIHALLTPPTEPSENTAARATAVDPSTLTPEQARVAGWLARKYRVASEPMAALVIEAQKLSQGTRLKPNLILAIVAIESNFHPYIVSEAGAQGLMQVMRKIHKKRFEEYGGESAAFDPLVNMRVGVQILNDFVRQQGGDVDAGLRGYLGGVALQEDNGYVAKVRAEEAELDAFASRQQGTRP